MTAIAAPTTEAPTSGADFIALDEHWSTHNYHPLPVMGQG